MSRHILIADDEEHLGFMIKFKLEKSGFQVEWKTNGREALEAMQASPPGLAILDVMMPGMTGFEVLEAMKDDPSLKDIPVIMLTARDQQEDTLKGLEMGVAEYIVKPFRPAELLAYVKRLLP